MFDFNTPITINEKNIPVLENGISVVEFLDNFGNSNVVNFLKSYFSSYTDKSFVEYVRHCTNSMSIPEATD